MSSLLTSRRLLAGALLCAFAACGPAPGSAAQGPDWAERQSQVALPLTCPAGVSVCSGAGANPILWMSVSGSDTVRTDVGQVLEVPVKAWPGVVRLVAKRELPGSSAKKVPSLVVELRSASASGVPNGPVIARGTLDVSALPCATPNSEKCDGEAALAEVPLVPLRGAQKLSPRVNGKGQQYVLTVGGDGTGTVKVRMAVHAQPFTGKRVQGELMRTSSTARWSPGSWTLFPVGSALAFSLTLDWDRVGNCYDGVMNGDETSLDCGAGCGPCATGRSCTRDGDCQASATCRAGVCLQKNVNGGRCSRAAECHSGHCSFAGVCRSPTCNNARLDPGERGLDCGGPCDGCEAGSACTLGTDCASGVCGPGATGVCLEQSCTDGVRAAEEMDVDCGGPCAPCGKGQRCFEADDCLTGACVRGSCVEPGCRDGRDNGTETDVDCGGTACVPCTAGKACERDEDCVTGACVASVCVTPSCTDGLRNGNELDADCGGSCGPCGAGKACASGAHCQSRICTPAHTCAASTCSDRVLNGTETDVDCGGGCPPCEAAKRCSSDDECVTSRCAAGRCERASCTDGVKGSSEGDVDCGGACQVKCVNDQGCRANRDCLSNRCVDGKCAAGSCADGQRTDEETDVDCGGGVCGPCAVTKRCRTPADCASGACLGGICRAATCTDALANGRETGKDCGGPCVPCAVGLGCVGAADCGSQVCGSATCALPASNDSVRNGTETDVDCGGPDISKRCPSGRRCARTKDCYRNALCTQNICLCPKGAVCRDAPGAADEQPGPDSICATYPSGTVCICRDGFAGDGYTCEDVDECLEGLLACPTGSLCVNEIGSAFCECVDGLVMVNGLCMDVDECMAEPCDGHATCTNTDGGYNCACDAPDWMGDGGFCEPTNTAPTISAVSLSPSSPTATTPVVATVSGVYDAQNDRVTLLYNWTVNAVAVPSVTGSTMPTGMFKSGQYVAVKVTPTDGRLSGPTVTASVRVLNSPPNTPTLAWGTANPVGGAALDCVVTTPVPDPDGDTVYYRYYWYVNGVQRQYVPSNSSRTNTLPASITSDGGAVSCKVDAFDGSTWSSATTLTATLSSPCTWTSVTSYPLTSKPANSILYTGSAGTQAVASVGGRTAWLQGSDYNQLFVLAGVTSTDDVVAVQADVYAPSDTTFVLGSLTEHAPINDIFKGYDVGYDRQLNQIGVTANSPYSKTSICCSSGASLGVSPVLASAPVNGWHTLRTEHRKLSPGRVRVYLDGAELFGVSGQSAVTWTGRYVRLESSSPVAFQASNVAFSNVKVEKGTGGCFKTNTSPCSSSAECASGQCVDGVCCDSACTGSCKACNLTGSVGTCRNIFNGQDPADECPGAQACNGSGACL